MPDLEITPIPPLPDDREQPLLLVRYTCVYPGCGKACEQEQRPGFVPRYCEEHKEKAKKEAAQKRVERWRKAHPEEARQSQRDYRNRRRQSEDTGLR